MPNILNFYLDDSGTRHPNHARGKRAKHDYDWFALGGVLVREEEEGEVRSVHAEFCQRWNISKPLHSSEIRSKNEGFLWLRSISETDQIDFYESLYQMMRSVHVTGIACVVDRPGYNQRYSEMYKQKPWLLCKTAFSVVVERAAKHARALGRRLRVMPERCNKLEDEYLRNYYDALKVDGMPFAADSSGKYAPLPAEYFRETLHEFRLKKKTSPLAQLADLYLWPMCMGGYNASNRPYARLLADGKLIECALAAEAWPTLGTKYSCFDLVDRRS